MKRYCFALDLKDDPALMEEYKEHHKRVWPERIETFKKVGIRKVDIYNVKNRLFLIMETDEDFSFEKKDEVDRSYPRVMEWEDLMWEYQQQIPGSKDGERWLLMEKIYSY